MKYLLSFREKNRGGPVVPGGLRGGAGLGDRAALEVEASVVVLLHGFNVNFRDGRNGLLRLAGLLSASQDAGIVAVTWPGDHWTGPLSYSFEGRDADDTAFELTRYLDDVLRPDATLSFVAHSLGCRVTMETVKRLRPLGRSIGQVCLMAPAIDDDSLAGPAEYRAETLDVDRLAVMSSRKDSVLKFAYPPGDLLQSFLFRDDSGDYALGYHGPRPHRNHGVPQTVLDLRIPKNKKVGHGDYVPAASPNDRQRAAAAFADAVIAGSPDPQYV
jgi:hypothetical protein